MLFIDLMLKHAMRFVGLLVVVCLTALVVSQRLFIAKLQTDLQSLREQSEQLHEPATENAGHSLPSEQTTQPEIRTSEPSLELLRLRGEVGLLRQERNEVAQLRDEIARLHQEIRVIRGPTPHEMFGNNFDPNSLPKFEIGATREEVLEELRRVGAKVLDENEKFVHAQLFKTGLSSTNGAVVPATIELYFVEGKLATRRLVPKDFRRRTPNPFE